MDIYLVAAVKCEFSERVMAILRTRLPAISLGDLNAMSDTDLRAIGARARDIADIRETARLTATMMMPLPMADVAVGQRVTKISGDYRFRGWVVASFEKRNGFRRYVVENDDGILHIFNGKDLAVVADGTKHPAPL
jgi:hypothetical protein